MSRPSHMAPARSVTRLQSDERWEQILTITSELFLKKGFSGTSMRDISAAVGLLKGSLYYYIKSKEDLLVAILTGLHDDGEEIIRSVHFGTDDPLKELRRYLKKAVIFAGENAARLAIFLRDFEFVPEVNRKEIISERDMYVVTAQRLLEEAANGGLLTTALDPHLAAVLMMGAVSSTHEWLKPTGARPLPEIAEAIAIQLVDGIRSDSVQRAPARRGRTAPRLQRS